MNDDLEKLRLLEESLWREETRFDRQYMEQILAPGFFEFGRSGRRYTREESLAVPKQAIRAKLPLEGFEVTFVRPDVALVAYISEVEYETIERANRASLWVRSGGRWQLAFHQGTPI